eukprot:10971680-Karenia_brevis.AAC.1
MSGGPTELIRDACGIFTDDKRKKELIQDILFWLLDNQYLEVDCSKSKYKVKIGTGMGLKHSGEVADAALYVKAERDLLQDHQLIFYHRFKDDFLLCGNQREYFVRWCRLLKKYAGYFKITFEKVGHQQ